VGLTYVSSLMAKNYEAVGFIPEPRLEHYFQRGQVLLQTENDDPCGYLVFGNGWPRLRVYQCCVQIDARRLDHATELIRRLVNEAYRRHCTSISLWCADDLAANAFWKAAGFEFVGQRDNHNRRGRKHNGWLLRLPNSIQGDLFEVAA